MQFLGVAMIALLTACPGLGNKTLEELAPPSDVPPTWESHIEAILTEKCGQCHGDPSPVGTADKFRFDKYDKNAAGGSIDGAVERLTEIKDRALTKGNMPPTSSPALTDTEKSLLGEWIMNGGPETSNATWNGGVGDLIKMKCGSCHKDQDPPAGTDSFRLDVYNKAEAGGSKNGAFDMIDRITERALQQKTMPPGEPLSVSEQIKIQQWIDNKGALD